MLRLRHVAECVGGARGRKHAVRQRTKLLRSTHLQHLAAASIARGRAALRCAPSRSATNTEMFLRRRPHSDFAVLVDVGLADFDEPPVGPQNGEALVDRLAGSEFSTKSTPSPSVNFSTSSAKARAARVHHMRHTERA